MVSLHSQTSWLDSACSDQSNLLSILALQGSMEVGSTQNITIGYDVSLLSLHSEFLEGPNRVKLRLMVKIGPRLIELERIGAEGNSDSIALWAANYMTFVRSRLQVVHSWSCPPKEHRTPEFETKCTGRQQRATSKAFGSSVSLFALAAS